MDFGKTTENFNRNYFIELYKEKKIDAMKEYVFKYFLKLNTTLQTFMWIPEEKKFDILDDTLIRSRYFTKDLVFYTADGKKSSFSDWFFGIYNPSYRPCMKINKPRVFIGSAGTEYVNFFPELLQGSKPRKQFKDFSIEVQQKVNKVWEHLNIVWCSRKKEQFEYCKLWFAKTISGVKMTTAINLKSIKGIGKSAFIDFLRKSVLGNDVIYQTSNTNIIS